MFFERYRVTGEWNEDSGFSASEFSVQNIRFPNLVYDIGIVLERQHSGDWIDHRIGVQHAWQNGQLSTYVLGTVGETFVEGVALARYERDLFSDMIIFTQLEAVGDISYQGKFLFATERARFGMQKDVYSIALAGDVVQTGTEQKATGGLAGAVQF